MSNTAVENRGPFAEIRVLTLHAIRGANYWSRHPVIRLDVSIGAYEEISSADVPNFTERLIRAIPILDEHRCSIGTRGGFIQRLREGTYTAHITEHVALALQEMVGYDVGYGQTRGTGDVGNYTVVFAYKHEEVALRAAVLALEIVQAAFAGTLESVDYAIAQLRTLAKHPMATYEWEPVLCGITGGSGRTEARDALIKLCIDKSASQEDKIVAVSPAQLLQEGLSYSYSDIAVILDSALADVPARYRDPERAAQLVAVVADAVPPHGTVVCAADAHDIHNLVRKAGRRLVTFEPTNDVGERARHAATIAATALHELTIGHRVR